MQSSIKFAYTRVMVYDKHWRLDPKTGINNAKKTSFLIYITVLRNKKTRNFFTAFSR